MRLFVWKLKSLILLASVFLTILIALIFITFGSIKSVNVFNVNKELPIYSVEKKEKLTSITFDCAWGAGDIPKIIDILKKEDVKATFFIVGQWAEKYPEMVKLISASGHDVGSHGYSHLRMGALDIDKTKLELNKGAQVIESLTKSKVELFRPPYGDYNDSLIKISKSLGYYPIQWSVDSLDWKEGISKQDITDKVMKKLNVGSIILFHNDTPHTADILQSIIKNIKERGFQMVPVSKLIIRDNYYMDFEGKQKVKK